MTKNITTLDPDSRGLEKVIEELLERVKSGKVSGVAIAMANPSGITSNFMYLRDDQNPVHILGEIRLLERDLVDCFCQTRRQPSWEFCEEIDWTKQ